VAVVGGSTDFVEVAVAGSTAAVAAGLTVGAMGAEADGSTAGRRLSCGRDQWLAKVHSVDLSKITPAKILESAFR
jgi:hypothetical protein